MEITSTTELLPHYLQYPDVNFARMPQYHTAALTGNLVKPFHGMLCVGAHDDNGAVLQHCIARTLTALQKLLKPGQ